MKHDCIARLWTTSYELFLTSSTGAWNISQVEAMILKKLMKLDPEAQVIEDALCLGECRSWSLSDSEQIKKVKMT